MLFLQVWFRRKSLSFGIIQSLVQMLFLYLPPVTFESYLILLGLGFSLVKWKY